MAKAYGFEGFNSSKSFGDCTGGEKIIIVKGAASKEDARTVAEKNFGTLRIVNGGRTFANEAKAEAWASGSVNLSNRVASPGDVVMTWCVVDAAMQRGIAKLVGM